MFLHFGCIPVLVLCTDDVDDNVFNLDFILAICGFGLQYIVGLNDESITGIVEVQLVDSTLKKVRYFKLK
jgi:hypothetical protein